MSDVAPDSIRSQRTIDRPVAVSGIGYLTGADVTLRFLPAEPNHGIAFGRTDCPGAEPIPALIEYAVERRRRTAIEYGGIAVEMIEHVMAALAGLQIDNCLVQLDAPEPPGCDGSSLAFVDALLQTEFVEQNAPRPCVDVDQLLRVSDESGTCQITARPLVSPPLAKGGLGGVSGARYGQPIPCGPPSQGGQTGGEGRLIIGYQLDYGPQSPIPPQTTMLPITPGSFVDELAFARTFVLQAEVEALKAQGYGRRTTAKDLLVFGADGVIDNRLRTSDECARHKLLDCVGDFALLGCDLSGHFTADRSGHRLNREMVRRLRAAHADACGFQHRRAA